MKTVTKRLFFYSAAMLMLLAGGLSSCNNPAVTDAEIEELQARYDNIMMEYQQMRNDNTNYTADLAKKDSVIAAQAAEIEDLLLQLRACQSDNVFIPAAPAMSSDEVARLKEEIAQKQKTIEELMARLDEQSSQLKNLESNKTNNNLDASARVALEQLRQQVDEQSMTIRTLNEKLSICEDQNQKLNKEVSSQNTTIGLLNTQINTLSDNQSSDKQRLAKDNADCQAQVASLQKAIEEQKAEIARLNKDLAARMSELEKTQRSLEAAQSEAATAKANAKSAATAKGTVNKKLAALQELCDSYAAEIDRLRKENEELKNQNSALRDSVLFINEVLDRTNEHNTKLTRQLDRAAVLATDNFSVTPIKRVGNSAGKETNRANACGAVKVDGRLLENRIVDPGTVILYLVITDPRGKVVCNGTLDEYNFMLLGERTQYTAAQDVEFTGDSRPFSIIWVKGEDIVLESGIYNANIYANGHQIGFTSFRLK